MQAMDPEARALGRIGTVLKEKYRLDSLLGIGGMAVVYAATHRNAKRVAIKMLLPELANDADVRARFVQEGYAANTIQHAGALSVLDDDESEEGLPYLVMELLEGETVEARWEKAGQRMDTAEVLAIAAAILDVLAAAHGKGIVHRDIKPENVFLVRGGGVKVLDFGIARVLEQARGKSTSTRAGVVMGTPAFMAPEQAMAKWDEVDGRTDVWAVGASMFTLLSGRFVHEGQTGNEQLIRSATTPARSLGSVVTGVPRSVIALVDRALAFERARRWPDARAMGEAIAGAYEALTGGALVLEAPATSSVLSPRRGPASGRRTSSGDMPSTLDAAPSRPSGTVRAEAGPLPPPRAASPSQAQTVLGAAPPSRQSHAVIGAVPTSSGPFSQTRPSGGLPAAAPARSSNPQVGMDAGLAPPPMSAFSVEAFVAARNAERDAAAAEVTRLQPVVVEVQTRVAAARRKVASVQEQIVALRKERAAEDERYRRQTNARLEGVGEARKSLRKALAEVARLALDDAKNFPPPVGAAERVDIERTEVLAIAKARENALYATARDSFDARALRTGVLVAIAAVILFLALLVSPVIVRSWTSDTGTLAPASHSGE